MLYNKDSGSKYSVLILYLVPVVTLKTHPRKIVHACLCRWCYPNLAPLNHVQTQPLKEVFWAPPNIAGVMGYIILYVKGIASQVRLHPQLAIGLTGISG